MKLADVLPGKVQRAVEAHMLDEVREAALVFVFEHRARIDDEPKLGARLRLPVLADVVAEPVRQRADRDQRIDRNGLVERGVQNVAGGAGCCAPAKPTADVNDKNWERTAGGGCGQS